MLELVVLTALPVGELTVRYDLDYDENLFIILLPVCYVKSTYKEG